MKSKDQYTEEDERALKDLSSASEVLRRSVGGKVGESAENKYREAYIKCYRLGLKQYPPTICKSTR